MRPVIAQKEQHINVLTLETKNLQLKSQLQVEQMNTLQSKIDEIQGKYLKELDQTNKELQNANEMLKSRTGELLKCNL